MFKARSWVEVSVGIVSLVGEKRRPIRSHIPIASASKKSARTENAPWSRASIRPGVHAATFACSVPEEAWKPEMGGQRFFMAGSPAWAVDRHEGVRFVNQDLTAVVADLLGIRGLRVDPADYFDRPASSHRDF